MTATWRYAPLKASTMRVSVIWTANAILSTAVVYTVKLYRAGTVLGTYTVNQTLAPSGTPDGSGHTFQVLGSYSIPDGEGLVVVQSNGTSSNMIADTLRFERTSPDDSIKILATDVVTATWGDGWATCQAGPAPAATSPVPVTNLVGGQLYPALPTSTTMKIGWNLGFIDGGQSYLMYQNVAEQGYYYGGPFTSNPTPYTDIDFTFIVFPYDSNGLCWPNLPNGPWTLLWDGASALTPTTSGNGTVTIDATAPNRVDFTASGGWSSYGAALAIQVQSTGGGPSPAPYTYDFDNVRILPGGSDLVNPPKFRADFLDVISHGHSVRHLNTLQSAYGNCTDFADFNNASPSKAQIVRTEEAGFARIEAYTGSDFGFPLSSDVRAILLKITTPEAHRFATGQYITLSYSGPDLVLTTATPTADWPSPITRNLAGQVGPIWVLDATHYVLLPFIQLPAGYTMSNVLVDPDPAGFARMDVMGTMPCQDICDLANLTGTSPCIPLPFSTSDAALDALGAFYATHLTPGIKLRVQTSNEVWNFGVSLPYATATIGTVIYYGGAAGYYITYYVEKAQLQWDRMKAAFVGAGGDPADFVRVLDGCIALSGGGGTADIFAYMHSEGLHLRRVLDRPVFRQRPGDHPGRRGRAAEHVPGAGGRPDGRSASGHVGDPLDIWRLRGRVSGPPRGAGRAPARRLDAVSGVRERPADLLRGRPGPPRPARRRDRDQPGPEGPRGRPPSPLLRPRTAPLPDLPGQRLYAIPGLPDVRRRQNRRHRMGELPVHRPAALRAGRPVAGRDPGRYARQLAAGPVGDRRGGEALGLAVPLAIVAAPAVAAVVDPFETEAARPDAETPTGPLRGRRPGNGATDAAPVRPASVVEPPRDTGAHGPGRPLEHERRPRASCPRDLGGREGEWSTDRPICYDSTRSGRDSRRPLRGPREKDPLIYASISIESRSSTCRTGPTAGGT